MTCTFYRFFVNQQIPPTRNDPNEEVGTIFRRTKIRKFGIRDSYEEASLEFWRKTNDFKFPLKNYYPRNLKTMKITTITSLLVIFSLVFISLAILTLSQSFRKEFWP